MLHTTVVPIEAGIRHSARRLMLRAAWGALTRTASRIATWHRRRCEIKRTVGALSQLSDHLLADIGIRRGEIMSIAHSGRNTVRDRL
jgi:uncharacterized protein YjiS (DUF1127 family)